MDPITSISFAIHIHLHNVQFNLHPLFPACQQNLHRRHVKPTTHNAIGWLIGLISFVRRFFAVVVVWSFHFSAVNIVDRFGRWMSSDKLHPFY